MYVVNCDNPRHSAFIISVVEEEEKKREWNEKNLFWNNDSANAE